MNNCGFEFLFEDTDPKFQSHFFYCELSIFYFKFRKWEYCQSNQFNLYTHTNYQLL